MSATQMCWIRRCKCVSAGCAVRQQLQWVHRRHRPPLEAWTPPRWQSGRPLLDAAGHRQPLRTPSGPPAVRLDGKFSFYRDLGTSSLIIVHIAKSAMTWTVESLWSDLKRQTVSTDSQWGYVVTRSSRDDRSIYLCSYYLILSTWTSGLAFLVRIRWSVKKKPVLEPECNYY